MFPIRDHNPSNRTPFVTWALIAANVLTFSAYWPLFSEPPAIEGFFQDWALIPAMVSRGEGLHGVVTSMFLHGGILHLAGNMLFLWIFGDNLEDVFGHVGFALFYLASGVGAAMLQLLSAPYSGVPMIGASGAIAGVMGGYLLLFPKARIDVLLIIVIFIRIITLPAWVMLGVWFGFQLLSGSLADAGAGGVAYWAHAGGFAVGFALTLPAWLRRGGPAYWRRTHGLPPYPERVYSIRQTRIPRVPGRRGPWTR